MTLLFIDRTYFLYEYFNSLKPTNARIDSLNLLKLSEFWSLSDFITTPSMNVNGQAYFDKAFSALGSFMNDNAGGMLKAWLDEICLKFRSIRKQHQSHSERLRVLECALRDITLVFHCCFGIRITQLKS